MTTLRDVIWDNRSLFYFQTWYQGERFLDGTVDLERGKIPAVVIEDARSSATNAATLAYLYALNPDAPVWTRYLWTSDRDNLGQQVYLGVNNGKMEIHRHLQLTERWGVPIFPD